MPRLIYGFSGKNLPIGPPPRVRDRVAHKDDSLLTGSGWLYRRVVSTVATRFGQSCSVFWARAKSVFSFAVASSVWMAVAGGVVCPSRASRRHTQTGEVFVYTNNLYQRKPPATPPGCYPRRGSPSDFFESSCVFFNGAGPQLIFREVEDRDLIDQARRGKVEAYNLLVSRWEKRIYNYLLRLVKNREDALDLAQDVFLKAYQNLKKLEDPGRFGPWLYRIAHNEAYSSLRKNRPETDLEDAEFEPWIRTRSETPHAPH